MGDKLKKRGNVNIKSVTTDELEKELERRKKKLLIPPKQDDNPDFLPLIELCTKYVDFVASDDFHDDNDWEYYIYEATMEALYGKAFWSFINSKTR